MQAEKVRFAYIVEPHFKQRQSELRGLMSERGLTHGQISLAGISVTGMDNEQREEVNNLVDEAQREDSPLWQKIVIFLHRVCDKTPLELRNRYVTMGEWQADSWHTKHTAT